MYGYVLVAPKEHRERVVDDFTEDEYAELQRIVHRVGRAVCRAVPTERLYVLSLGSAQENSHVHWHVVPLPPGVPFEEQQLAALDTDLGFDLSDEELEELAGRIRAALEAGG
jgi:diadenosine tetraphosphate (Ap4A) HIT family hydrolase